MNFATLRMVIIKFCLDWILYSISKCFIHVCVHPHCQNIHTFHHFVNRRLEARQLVISSHEHSRLCTIHLHHSIFFHHNLIMSQLSQSLPFSPSLLFPFPIPIYTRNYLTLYGFRCHLSLTTPNIDKWILSMTSLGKTFHTIYKEDPSVH